jgi:hypothetical protein
MKEFNNVSTRFFSEWLEETPDEMPDVECFEALLKVENPLWQDCKLRPML